MHSIKVEAVQVNLKHINCHVLFGWQKQHSSALMVDVLSLNILD